MLLFSRSRVEKKSRTYYSDTYLGADVLLDFVQQRQEDHHIGGVREKSRYRVRRPIKPVARLRDIKKI